MVVVIAIMGIAIAVVAPSMILEPHRTTLGTVISDARRTALAKSETVTLSVAQNGAWQLTALRPASIIASGDGIPMEAGTLVLSVSPLGVCTIDVASDRHGGPLDPFTCTFSDTAPVIPR